jgi:hypothetical protein
LRSMVVIDTQQQAQLNGGKNIKIQSKQELHALYRTTGRKPWEHHPIIASLY